MRAAALQPGLRVGNYRLLKIVGRGAFGQVWRAVHHERPRGELAVKVATDPDFTRQLRREACLPDIEHANIVSILDSDTLGDPPYVVMPLCAGGSVADLLRDHPQGLPEQRVERILWDVVAGLSAAHAAGVIHRDIKPSNILLDADGRALLSDFGLSRLSQSAGPGSSMIQSLSLEREGQTLAGTLAYLAPEVLHGAEPSPASDVYSLGMVLFEMLTGRLPQGFERPSGVRAGLSNPESWDRLFERACAGVSSRPAHAARVADLMATAPKKVEEPRVNVRPSHAAPVDTAATTPEKEASAVDVSRRQQEAAAEFGIPALRTLDLGNGVTMEFVLIPPGDFVMGSPDSEDGGSEFERPQRRVRIVRPYYMSRTQVTQAQWRAVTLSARQRDVHTNVGEKLSALWRSITGDDISPSHFTHEHRPVEHVSWTDSQAFCRRLSDQLGVCARLPTEAEWEYACRAGTQTAYSFGDDARNLGDYAWYCDNAGSTTHPVAQKKPNAWSLRDLHGNVWEWCEDVWHNSYQGAPTDGSAWTTGGDQSCRVLRGGSWNYDPLNCRSAYRYWSTPGSRYGDVGFRVVLDLN